MDGKSSNLSISFTFDAKQSDPNSHCAVSAYFVSESLLSVHVKHPCCHYEVKQPSEYVTKR